LIIVF